MRFGVDLVHSEVMLCLHFLPAIIYLEGGNKLMFGPAQSCRCFLRAELPDHFHGFPLDYPDMCHCPAMISSSFTVKMLVKSYLFYTLQFPFSFH